MHVKRRLTTAPELMTHDRNVVPLEVHHLNGDPTDNRIRTWSRSLTPHWPP